MPRPGVGNPGNKGGGRKSAYQEMIDAQDLIDIWNGKKTKKKLDKILRSGKFGVKHVLAAKCMSGNPQLIAKMMDKIFATKTELKSSNLIDFGNIDPLDKEKLEKL
jgi:hypothetical protein